jgi:hypothetical protein
LVHVGPSVDEGLHQDGVTLVSGNDQIKLFTRLAKQSTHEETDVV